MSLLSSASTGNKQTPRLHQLGTAESAGASRSADPLYWTRAIVFKPAATTLYLPSLGLVSSFIKRADVLQL